MAGFIDSAPSSGNVFEDLCRQASREGWCWNLACTTCGHAKFGDAFEAIMAGSRPGGDARRYAQPAPEPADELPFTGEKRLQAACKDADLAAIAATCRFPDWLGYLGLVLAHTPWTEKSSGTLTKAWAPQLLAMVSESSLAHRRLGEIIADDGERLSLSDLELVEEALMDRPPG